MVVVEVLVGVVPISTVSLAKLSSTDFGIFGCSWSDIILVPLGSMYVYSCFTIVVVVPPLLLLKAPNSERITVR